jgi:hypothetical protein
MNNILDRIVKDRHRAPVQPNPYMTTGEAVSGPDARPFEKLAERDLPPEARDSRRYVMRRGEQVFLGPDQEPDENEEVRFAAPLRHTRRTLGDGVVV